MEIDPIMSSPPLPHPSLPIVESAWHLAKGGMNLLTFISHSYQAYNDPYYLMVFLYRVWGWSQVKKNILLDAKLLIAAFLCEVCMDVYGLWVFIATLSNSSLIFVAVLLVEGIGVP